MKAERDFPGADSKSQRRPELRVEPDMRSAYRSEPTFAARPEMERAGDHAADRAEPQFAATTAAMPVNRLTSLSDPRLAELRRGEGRLADLTNSETYGEERYRRGEDLLRRRRAHNLRRIVMPTVLLVTAIAAFVAWRAGTFGGLGTSFSSFALKQSVYAGLVVENVKIAGTTRLSDAEVREVLAAPSGTPIFAIDPDDIRSRIESIGWVKSVAVARELPNTISIVIEERKPVALWQRNGNLTLIDDSGHPITSLDLDAWSDLPQVVGKGAEHAAADLMPILNSEPDMAKLIKAAVRVGERRWDIVFANGIRARLPEDDTTTAWRKLAELERDHHLLAREINVIDLRQADRLVLRLTKDELDRRREAAEAAKGKGGNV